MSAAAATIECLGNDVAETLELKKRSRNHTAAWRSADLVTDAFGLTRDENLLSRIDALGRLRNASLHHRPYWSRVDDGAPHPDRERFGLAAAEKAVDTLILWLQLVASGEAVSGSDSLVDERARGICDAASNAAHHLRERTNFAVGSTEDGD